MPVFDLQIHPRDHELIAATHGRSLWIVDIAALEQMTPKVVAQGTYLFKPKTAYQWGEGAAARTCRATASAQAEMTYANPPYGADIVYRLGGGRAEQRCGSIVSDAARRHARERSTARAAPACITSTGTSRSASARRGGRAVAVAAS